MQKIIVTWFLVKKDGKRFCVKVEHYASNVYAAKKAFMEKYEITQSNIITSSNEHDPWPKEESFVFDGTKEI